MGPTLVAGGVLIMAFQNCAKSEFRQAQFQSSSFKIADQVYNQILLESASLTPTEQTSSSLTFKLQEDGSASSDLNLTKTTNGQAAIVANNQVCSGQNALDQDWGRGLMAVLQRVSVCSFFNANPAPNVATSTIKFSTEDGKETLIYLTGQEGVQQGNRFCDDNDPVAIATLMNLFQSSVDTVIGKVTPVDCSITSQAQSFFPINPLDAK